MKLHCGWGAIHWETYLLVSKYIRLTCTRSKKMNIMLLQELSDIQAAFIERLPWAVIAMQSGHSNVEQSCAAEKNLSEVHNLSVQSVGLPQAWRPVYSDPLAGRLLAQVPLLFCHRDTIFKQQGPHCCFSKLITPLYFSVSLSISPSLKGPINLKGGGQWEL